MESARIQKRVSGGICLYLSSLAKAMASLFILLSCSYSGGGRGFRRSQGHKVLLLWNARTIGCLSESECPLKIEYDFITKDI